MSQTQEIETIEKEVTYFFYIFYFEIIEIYLNFFKDNFFIFYLYFFNWTLFYFLYILPILKH
jgi:hypothetical protein